jgi:hypothetical protein
MVDPLLVKKLRKGKDDLLKIVPSPNKFLTSVTRDDNGHG